MRLMFALWLATAVGALALEPPPPYFEDAAMDGQGVVWAYSRAEYNQIYSFDGKMWTVRPAQFPQSHSAMPTKVVKMSDGSMACVWRMNDGQTAVTRHAGTETQLLGTCPGDISASGLTVMPLADSQNRLWITGPFPRVCRADKIDVKVIHDFAPDEFANAASAQQGYNDIKAVEDGQGRVWIWSNPRSSNYARLRGVSIFTGDKVDEHDAFGAIKGDQITTIARADAKHMWMSVAYEGLYKVDINTFAAERMPEPAPQAFFNVNDIQVIGGDVYAIASQRGFQNSLWRLREGQWKELIPHLDQNPFQPRSWLPLKNGVLMEAFGGGPYFIPKEGGPAQLSWRSGFPLEDAHGLCQFADGTYFAIGQGDKLFHGPLTLPPRAVDNPRIVDVEPDRGWIKASTGHFWMIPKEPALSLKEWDGTQWIVHDFPPGAPQGSGINEDDKGRLWINTENILIFDPATGKWQSFQNPREAFGSFMHSPVHFLHDEWILTPQYSPDHNQFAYRRGVIEVNYFNGTDWKTFNRAQIMGKSDGDNAVGQPWFDEQGKLWVNLRRQTSWRLEDDGTWSKQPFVSHFPADIWSEESHRSIYSKPPDGAVTEHPESCVLDNLGTTWLTWNGQLYKCVPGASVAVFGPDEINPFLSKRLLREAFTDSQGNTFLQTASSTMQWFMLRPKGAAPKTSIEMKARGADSFEAKLDAHTTQPVTFRWQLDGGAMQLTKTNSILLDHLPNGSHTLQVTAIDDQLNVDASPATATFETKIDPDQQMAALIAGLKDPDFAQRQKAVDALALQPALALPALKKARESADDDARWWIDAAIQAAEATQAREAAKNKQ